MSYRTGWRQDGIELFLAEYIDRLVQEKRNSSALAMELCLSCTNPSMKNKQPMSRNI